MLAQEVITLASRTRCGAELNYVCGSLVTGQSNQRKGEWCLK